MSRIFWDFDTNLEIFENLIFFTQNGDFSQKIVNIPLNGVYFLHFRGFYSLESV